MGAIQLGVKKMIGVGPHAIMGGAELWGGDNAPVLRILSSGGLSKKGRALCTASVCIRTKVRKKLRGDRKFLCKLPTDLNTSDMGTKLLDEKTFESLAKKKGVYITMGEDYGAVASIQDVNRKLALVWDNYMDTSFEDRCPLPILWSAERKATQCDRFQN